MIVIAVDRGTSEQRGFRLAKDDDTVVKFVSLNTEFS